MEKITVLIKPVSFVCNMQCDYCFYKDVIKYRTNPVKKMNKNVYLSIIKKTLNHCETPIEIEYCFQGGEPLLAGIEFYKDFIDEVNLRNTVHMIKYSIQTNGTLIDNQWIDLFKQYHFLVGISLDGIQITHDFHRRIKGEESFHKVIVAINLLKHNNIDFNILSVITSHMSMYAKDIYRFYKDMNFKYTQFIPCLPPLGGGVGLKPKEFFRFYRELYDEYRKDQQVHISLFDQIHYLLNGQIDCSCGMLGYCSIQIVIETDGSIYPCDFYAIRKYCLGNILHHSLKECITNKIAYIFLREEKEYSYVCDDCEFYSICQGNCKRQNVCMFDEYYCGYKELLKYIKNKEDKHNENI